MTVLGIETATETLSVAVVRDGICLGEQFIRMKNAHDRLLSVFAESLLYDLSMIPGDVGGVAVSAGPGSFTGLRIGMSYAKGFAAGLNISLAAVPTFDGIAHSIATLGNWEEEAELAVLFDARREDVYVAIYRLSRGVFEIRKSAEAMHMENLRPLIGTKALLAGGGAAKFAHYSNVPYRILGGEWTECHAGSIALLGEKMISRGQTADLAACEPYYAREFYIQGRP